MQWPNPNWLAVKVAVAVVVVVVVNEPKPVGLWWALITASSDARRTGNESGRSFELESHEYNVINRQMLSPVRGKIALIRAELYNTAICITREYRNRSLSMYIERNWDKYYYIVLYLRFGLVAASRPTWMGNLVVVAVAVVMVVVVVVMVDRRRWNDGDGVCGYTRVKSGETTARRTHGTHDYR